MRSNVVVNTSQREREEKKRFESLYKRDRCLSIQQRRVSWTLYTIYMCTLNDCSLHTHTQSVQTTHVYMQTGSSPTRYVYRYIYACIIIDSERPKHYFKNANLRYKWKIHRGCTYDIYVVSSRIYPCIYKRKKSRERERERLVETESFVFSQASDMRASS